ncbi:LiaI-LiaF-like domain-containing protein [Acidisarcina polymorpha]|uniref:LiaI-LiaF-like domain-containing protein n=1 Tax=Acidisarcina polymorpha TaxID=2211140 RepID=UPI001F28C303|nr:DUF5668 domain-containing protein [Acidisarcina polymorpha]
MAAKVGIPGAQPGVPFPAGGAFSQPGPNPALATILGVIPGVGAMYNGQFVKAMIHVLIFVLLIAITNEHDFFGFFIAAWVLYQIFDANQTAKARREGLPLPDPFGINELASRLGSQYPAGAARPPVQPGFHPGYPPPPYTPPVATPFVGEAYPPNPAAGAAYVPPPPNVPFTPSAPYPEVPPPPFPEMARRNEPAGAIALIVLGFLFLFGTLGIFRFDWIGRGWPLIIIAIGVWLFLKRARETTSGGGR